MLHLAASEVKQRLGQYITCALTEPVVIEKSGRPAVVMLSIAEYERLQALNDAYWGEKKPYADSKPVSMLRLNLTNAALSFLDDLPGKQFKHLQTSC